MKTVLVVEDELKIARVVRDYLTDAGYDVVVASSGEAALASARGSRPDLVVLDLGLPGVDGLDVARELRATSHVPIVMLTARGEETDRIVGLELGADDYVCKPFSPREVVARVKALLRRAQGRLAPTMLVPAAGGFAIDEAGQRILWQEQALTLTPVEFRLLRQLLQHPGRVFERAQLLDLIHEDFRDVSDRVVDSHIKNIRRKLAALDPPQECIASVYGVGYRLDLF